MLLREDEKIIKDVHEIILYSHVTINLLLFFDRQTKSD